MQELRNQYALRSAQVAFDNLLPDSSPTASDWLETVEGENWLYEAAHDLMRGMALRISGRTVLTPARLYEAVQKRLIERLQGDDENLLAQIVINSARGVSCQYEAGLLLSDCVPEKRDNERFIAEIAESLVAPFAGERLEELRQEAEQLAAEMAFA